MLLLGCLQCLRLLSIAWKLLDLTSRRQRSSLLSAAPIAISTPAGMGRGWIPGQGKLGLSYECRAEWPAAEIAAAGPENIRVLELGGNRLTSIQGAELAKLTNLEVLWLHDNLLTALPPEIGRLAALQKLAVEGNRLTALPPEIGRLAALRGLRLGQLTALPPEIGCLAALKWLYVGGSHGQLTALPPEIGRLAALETLWFGSQQLTALPPEIGRLVSLRQLRVHNNQLTALPPEIGRLAALQTLDVSHNQLTALPPEIGGLAALRYLYAHGNPVVDSWPEPVRHTVNQNDGEFKKQGSAQCAAVVLFLRSLPVPVSAAAPSVAPPAPRPPATLESVGLRRELGVDAAALALRYGGALVADRPRSCPLLCRQDRGMLASGACRSVQDRGGDAALPDLSLLPLPQLSGEGYGESAEAESQLEATTLMSFRRPERTEGGEGPSTPPRDTRGKAGSL
eukprot:tig00021603_g22817.t2